MMVALTLTLVHTGSTPKGFHCSHDKKSDCYMNWSHTTQKANYLIPYEGEKRHNAAKNNLGKRNQRRSVVSTTGRK